MKNKGFTLIEVIASMAIIGMLFSLVFMFMGGQNAQLNRIDIKKDLYNQVNEVLARAVVSDDDPTDGQLTSFIGDTNGTVLTVDDASVNIDGINIPVEYLVATKQNGLEHASAFTYNFGKSSSSNSGSVDSSEINVSLDILDVTSPFPINSFYSEDNRQELRERMVVDSIIEDGSLYGLPYDVIAGVVPVYEGLPKISDELYTIIKDAGNVYSGVSMTEIDETDISNILMIDNFVDGDKKIKENLFVVEFDSDKPIKLVDRSTDDLFGFYLGNITGSPSYEYTDNVDIVFINKMGFDFDTNFKSLELFNPNGKESNIYFLSDEIYYDENKDSQIFNIINGQITVASTSPKTYYLDNSGNMQYNSEESNLFEIEENAYGMFIYYPNLTTKINNIHNIELFSGISSKRIEFVKNNSVNGKMHFANWNGDYGFLGYLY